jgi:hypothetical protein
MNERIKELWSHAGGHYNSGNQHTWPEYTITDPEKFAELIVKECADVCERFGESGDGYTCSTVILEHFGVEE